MPDLQTVGNSLIVLLLLGSLATWTALLVAWWRPQGLLPDSLSGDAQPEPIQTDNPGSLHSAHELHPAAATDLVKAPLSWRTLWATAQFLRPPRHSTEIPPVLALRTFSWGFFIPWLLQMVLGVGVLLVSGARPAANDPAEPRSWFSMTVACLSLLAQGGCVFAVLRSAGMNGAVLRQWLRGPVRLGMAVPLGLIGFLASLIPVYTIVVGLHAWYGKNLPQHALLDMLRQHPHPGLIMLVVGLAVIGAPLVEELLYRVLLQTGLQQVLSPRWGIFTTAALFAAVHSLDGKLDAIPLFPLALILGVLYQVTRSYPAVVVAHAVFNGMNLVMLWLSPSSK